MTKRRLGLKLMPAFFGILAVNAWLQAIPGLLGGGAAILVIGLAWAWYLRRATAPPDPAPSS